MNKVVTIFKNGTYFEKTHHKVNRTRRASFSQMYNPLDFKN